mmetsp:Transcript_29375/g.54151  ORF Transcript_29375/g.54151 Transcript_29375/m.54151 type:complete len:212 (-) Transcript_29375:347-982(-)
MPLVDTPWLDDVRESIVPVPDLTRSLTVASCSRRKISMTSLRRLISFCSSLSTLCLNAVVACQTCCTDGEPELELPREEHRSFRGTSASPSSLSLTKCIPFSSTSRRRRLSASESSCAFASFAASVSLPPWNCSPVGFRGECSSATGNSLLGDSLHEMFSASSCRVESPNSELETVAKLSKVTLLLKCLLTSSSLTGDSEADFKSLAMGLS